MSQPRSPKSAQSQHISRAAHFGLALFISLPLVLTHVPNSTLSAGRETQAEVSVNEAAQEDQQVRQLELGKPIEQELAGGQSHSYQITLAADHYLHLAVEQRGIDVVVRLLGPDGKQIAEFDSEIRRNQGKETVEQVAEVAGDHRVNVLAKQNDAPIGRYEIQVLELRAATEKDHVLQEARKQNAELVRLYRAGKYDEALPLAERALELREKALGPERPDVAGSLNNLANVYRDKGDYIKAEPLYQRALSIREKTLGQQHPDIAPFLANLARLYSFKGDYTKAEPLFQRALDLLEKALGPEHVDVATSLSNLATVYRFKGDYAKAEPLYQRALNVYEKTVGTQHLSVVPALWNLANLYRDIGNYDKAEVLYKRELAIREKAQGEQHPQVASSLNSLANLYYYKGDYTQAEQLFRRALTIFEKTLGPEHPNVTVYLNNLANLYRAQGEYAKSESLLQRALNIQEKRLGAEHPFVAASLHSIASLYYDKGDIAKAEPLLRRALNIREKILGPEHPDVAASLNNLASLYGSKGELIQAEPMYQRALEVWEKALGPNHSFVASLHSNRAMSYRARGEAKQAIVSQTRSNEISELNLSHNLISGSERQKLAYLALFSKETNSTLSLHSQSAPDNPQALDLALTTLLRRKGRGLDAMTDTIATLRRHAIPQDQELFDQLVEARSQLAALTLRETGAAKPDSYQTRLKPIEEKVEKLEAELSARSAAFRAESQPVTPAAVQAALPAGGALVEFAVYTPIEPKNDEGKPPRYLAYALASQGAPRWVDLGEAAPIDRAIDAWRKALRDPGRNDVRRLARTVDEKVMRPVRALLGETRRVLIAPDGLLNLIPFSALVDEGNRYLVERYAISYLTSGRDLLRLPHARQSKTAPMVVANPAFGKAATIARQTGQNDGGLQAGNQGDRARLDTTRVFFQPLPGTEDEAIALKAILPEATVLMRERATEAEIKRASAPSILHIATHGFFLADQEAPPVETRGVVGEDLRLSRWAAKVENPLLRSGLVLAGANQGKSGDDDGILTALEAAGLDLWGTKLVVLSACDTGVGEVKNGEGVYGLRRALALAGSESQVMSLWPVPDEATKDLMIPYYKALKQRQGRGEGLRQVQLQMLKSKNRRHPFYWAGFIQSGEWANLEGKR